MRCSGPHRPRRSLGCVAVLLAAGAAPSQDAAWLRPVARIAANATDAAHATNARAIAMTGDGAQVLVTGPDGLRALPVAGGDAWRVSGVGAHARVVPFGNAAQLCAVDAASLVIADAAARTIVRRIDLAPLGLAGRTPTCLALRPDGGRAVLALHDERTHARTGWVLDVGEAPCSRSPSDAHVAVWCHDGFALQRRPFVFCGTPDPTTLQWLPSHGRPEDPVPCRAAGLGHGTTGIPGRRELVHAFWNDDADHVSLGRFDARTGELLAAVETASEVWVEAAVVAGHVVSVEPDAHRLDLRRLPDLRVVAAARVPGVVRVAACLACAEHAPRIVLRRGDELVVFDVVPPADAGK
jgi:hypothetical protein